MRSVKSTHRVNLYSTKKASCRYDEARRIFYKIYSGDIYFHDLVDTWNEMIGQNLIPEDTCRFVLDYSNATFISSPSGVDDICKFFRAYNHVFAHSRLALIMQKPDQVILPILVNNELTSISVKPFYTLEAGTRWVSAS